MLFKEAKKRGIKILFDLVAGHTSVEHPWFKSSCLPRKNTYSYYYIWTPCVWSRTGCGNWIRGYASRDGSYLSNFFCFQPALNYGYPNPDPFKPLQKSTQAPGPKAVRREMKSIMEHWLDMGCSGFRVDMAASLVKNDLNHDAALISE